MHIKYVLIGYESIALYNFPIQMLTIKFNQHAQIQTHNNLKRSKLRNDIKIIINFHKITMYVT